MARLVEAAAQHGVAGHHARPHERLAFPRPSVFLLVAGEPGHGAHHRAGAAGGPQAHVHLVELAMRRRHGERMEESAHQAVQRPVLGGGEVMQEHQIEI